MCKSIQPKLVQARLINLYIIFNNHRNMPTVTTHQSYGSRLMSSFTGVLIGILMFVAAFPVLWINEGRINKAILAEETTEISAETVNPEFEGMPVSMTDKVTSEETLGDIYIQPGEYLSLSRNVEMYAWVEHTSEDTTTNVGGSTDTTTTYTYSKEWTSSPASSSGFQEKTGHLNPAQTIESESFKVGNAKVGAYSVNMQNISLPGGEDLNISEEDAILLQDEASADETLLVNGVIFKGIGSLTSPAVGDYKITYSAFPLNSEVTVFGTAKGAEVAPYIGKRDTKLYRMFGSSRQAAIETLNFEHKMITWGLRALGFFLMWAGLVAIFKPLSTLLDVLPFLGKLSGMMMSGIAFLISAVLTIVTIVIASIFYNVYLLIAVIAAILGGVYYKFSQKDQKDSLPS